MSNERTSGDPAAIRLTFVHEDDELRLKRATRVAMRAPAGDGTRRTDQNERKERGDQKERDDRIGSWAEVRDANDSVLYRRTIDRPVPEDVEVHEGGEEGSFRRVERGEMSSLVNVLVPDLEYAHTIVLRERRLPTEDREEPKEIQYAEVPLDQIDEIDETDDTAPGNKGDDRDEDDEKGHTDPDDRDSDGERNSRDRDDRGNRDDDRVADGGDDDKNDKDDARRGSSEGR